jgi:hypothetical protein
MGDYSDHLKELFESFLFDIVLSAFARDKLFYTL